MEVNPTSIQNFGAGVMALAFIFWGITYYVKSIGPSLLKQNELLQKLYDNDSHNSEIIKNNTDAILELSKSNANVAEALKILDLTSQNQLVLFKQLDDKIIKHDDRAERLELTVTKMSEKLNNFAGGIKES